MPKMWRAREVAVILPRPEGTRLARAMWDRARQFDSLIAAYVAKPACYPVLLADTEGPRRMRFKTRYQGAIVQDGAVLLIQHREHATGRSYWLLPGGGMEAGETPQQAVAREMVEETGLRVAVERLVLDRSSAGSFYEREHTYLCTPLGGDARPIPGHEPEADAAAVYAIVDVRWVPLHDESRWGAEVLSDPITAGYLRALRGTLATAKGDLPTSSSPA